MIGERSHEIQAPDLIDPVIGYRAWRLRDGELLSPYVDVAWPSEPLRAECLRERVQFRVTGPGHEERAPASRCVCGIYAYFEPYYSVAADPQLVRGAVVLWGRIEVHRDGMRAEYARPVVLAEPPDWRTRKALLGAAQRLGIEAVEPPELRRAAMRHGRPLPAALMMQPPR